MCSTHCNHILLCYAIFCYLPLLTSRFIIHFSWLGMTVFLLCYTLNLKHSYVTCPDGVSSSLPPLHNAFIHPLQSTLSGVMAPLTSGLIALTPYSISFGLVLRPPLLQSPSDPNCMPSRSSAVSCCIPTKSTMRNSS